MSLSVLKNYSSVHKIEFLIMFLCCKFVKCVSVIMTRQQNRKPYPSQLTDLEQKKMHLLLAMLKQQFHSEEKQFHRKIL